LARKRSAPLNVPEFFTDRGLGKRVVDALRAEGWVVHSMQEEYPSSDRSRSRRFDDENWIPAVTQRGLPILSKDGFRYRHERQAIADCKARVFMIPSGHIRTEHMVERFTSSRLAIFEHCGDRGPFLFAIHPNHLQRVTLPTERR
jgi:hypothetical protein